MKLGPFVLALALAASAQAPAGFSVLVFSRTTGFRHSSIPDGIAAIQKLGSEHVFGVTATEDPAQFSTANLARFRAVVFLNTTGDVLDEAQQAAFEQYIRGGGDFAGVHSASDTEYEWPFYGRLVGAYFKSHPEIQPARIHVADRTHPSTRHLPEIWERMDEWYNFRAPLLPGVRVLARLDESSYRGGEMGGDHPIAWSHEMEGGRAWYNAGGHTEGSYREPEFVAHLLGGLRYAAGLDLERPKTTRPTAGRTR